MRLAVCALSAVMLSGCSWLGGFGSGGQGGSIFGNSSQFNANNGSYRFDQYNPCVIPSPRAPIPPGCNPANVTIGTASGGFPQQPNFGNPQYANDGFGTHAGIAGQQAAHDQPRKRLKKPKFRGSLAFGLEENISGDLLDHSEFPGVNPALFYNPADFTESFSEGAPRDGTVTTTFFTAVTEDIDVPNISYSDAHSTPLHIKGGVEYIKSPRTTFFANAGYGYSEGEGVRGAIVTGELQRIIVQENFRTIPAVDPVPGIAAVPATATTPAIDAVDGIPGTPEQIVLDSIGTSVNFIPNQNIANYNFDFSDQERIDLEFGARHYFNPIVRDQGFKTLTPFVGGSVGASYLNAVSFNISQDQVFYQEAFEAGGTQPDQFFDVVPNNISGPSQIELFDSEWVPTGQLNAGVEWQVTPKTALAFESGLRFERGREYSNGERASTNVAIPVTVRGSYNF